MSRAANVASGRRLECTARPRGYLGFVSAVVLFVLLAAVGLPSTVTLAAELPVATASEGAVLHAARAVARARAEPLRTLCRRSRTQPRPSLRQRSIQARGLPPTRAPTA
jgi:hypothetical protein